MRTTEDRKVYGNWEVYHPDGDLMFRCDEKKAKWYLDRNLANLTQPNKIQLTFVPRGKGHVNEPFYLTNKKNICVVCASDKFLTRHHAVPHCFRRYFPEHQKSKNSHDIVLLCNTCHNKYEEFAWQYKMQLMDEYGIKINFDLKDVPEESKRKTKAISYAFSLVNYGSKIPQERKNELKERISEFIDKDEITDDDIYQFMRDGYNQRIQSGLTNDPIPVTMGEAVIRKVTDLEEFIKKWRQHFVDTMNPQYLPELWSVDHKRERKDERIICDSNGCG